MNLAIPRPRFRSLQALAAAALAWASPAHCAPSRPAWSWAELWSDSGADLLLLWVTAAFWVVTHVWALLVLWAEARATRPSAPDAQPGTQKKRMADAAPSTRG